MKWKVLLSEYRLGAVLICLGAMVYLSAMNCFKMAPRVSGVMANAGMTTSTKMGGIIEQMPLNDAQRAFFDVQTHVLNSLERYVLGMGPTWLIASGAVFGFCLALFVQRIRRKLYPRKYGLPEKSEEKRRGHPMVGALLAEVRMIMLFLGMVALSIITINNYFVMVPKLTGVSIHGKLWSSELASLAPRALTTEQQWEVFVAQNNTLRTLEDYVQTMALPFLLPAVAGAALSLALLISRLRAAYRRELSLSMPPAPEMPA